MPSVRPTFEQFEALAEGATVVPVTRPLLADALTPVSAWSTLGGEPGSFLLESVEHGEKWGRYSFVGLRPALIARGRKGRFEVEVRGRIEGREVDDPWPALRERLAEWVPPREGLDWLPRFWGGAVGYVAYDAVRTFEPTVGERRRDPDAWDFAFAIGGTLVIFDDLSQRAFAVSLRRVDGEDDLRTVYDAACAELDVLVDELSRPRIPRLIPPPQVGFDGTLPPSSFTPGTYRDAVERAKEHIRAGDIFQVVPSQRFAVDGKGVDLFDVYRMLRAINPSPYMYYLSFPEVGIAGASPETLVRVEDGRAEVRPIAGTRKRGATREEDAAIAAELLADPKERAEHVMLVDLGRNDLGRISAPGTVRITEQMTIERYSHVMHLVSNVSGELSEGRDALDVLRATFPAGTLSGAPKVRAMQIIEELEPVARGIYGGAVGYVSFDGNLDMAIAIRTVVEQAGEIRVQAGGGVVEASDPEAEYEETVNKARAALGAVEAARRR
ncbi:MAG TPA: anthranilate synthase component I [Sandaracinaceae bacterium LLY-WYZ-13_1]|nr:anthranilate synthase component I [Sandaracinaceae bacterium LLY-WYZ-13_1]